MVYALRHFTIRFWATILLGGFACLWFLPLIQGYIGLGWTLLPVSGILALVFMGIGWLFNFFGRETVKRLLSEATAWERDSMHYEAERSFRKAVAVLDSFLLSPGVKRKTSIPLAAHLARFYLARADKDNISEDFIFSYLQLHPEDEEVAENWLQQILSYADLNKEHYELAFRIGNARPDNQTIQYLLAQFYLTEERTDFPALQTYRRVLSGNQKAADDIADKLSAIFLLEGRADEWALKIYLRAYRLNPDRRDLLKGIAACVHWIKETERTRHLLKAANAFLGGIDEDRLKTLRAGFNPPVPLPVMEKESLTHRFGMSAGRAIFRIGNLISGLIKVSVETALARFAGLIHFIKQSKRSKAILRWMVLVALATGVVILLVNTLKHLTAPDKATPRKAELPMIAVTDRFTIQVAAYLKPEHAKRFVENLKKEGVDAFWTKESGTKKTWYQVRVSHFPDKAIAKTYGESLKKRGIIDDFYVANYTHPQSLQNK